jgi:predicted acyl esterase
LHKSLASFRRGGRVVSRLARRDRGVNPHPAVKAISPQAPMTDTWMGDHFFHQGAFRQSFGVEYASAMELTKDGTKGITIGRHDHYDWYMQFPTLTTGTDADWVAKLIDVYPDTVKDDPRMGGYELMVASDILRGFSRRTPRTSTRASIASTTPRNTPRTLR